MKIFTQADYVAEFQQFGPAPPLTASEHAELRTLNYLQFDLRTPGNLITGYTTLLLETGYDPEYVVVIQNAVEATLATIEYFDRCYQHDLPITQYFIKHILQHLLHVELLAYHSQNPALSEVDREDLYQLMKLHGESMFHCSLAVLHYLKNVLE
jgi:hypothetical protein